MAILTMELVRQSIVKYEEEIKVKPKDRMDKLFAELNLSMHEIIVYQEKKSIAFTQQKIDQPLAMYLYRKLNNWDTTTLAERVTLTQVFFRLMLG